MTADPPVGAASLSGAKRSLLEQRLRARSGQAPRRSAIGTRPVDSAPQLSYAQERLWFSEQLAPGSGALTIAFVVRLRGGLDVACLRQALDALLQRHESLRMRFPATGDGRPTVVVDQSTQISMPVALLDTEPADGLSAEQRADELLRRAAAEPFDLADGPPVRTGLVRLAADEHLLLFAVHHIVADGWSNGIVVDDLIALYRAARGNGPPPAALPVRYSDYAYWQRDRLTGPELARQVDFWRTELADVPALELPLDHPRPASQGYTGAQYGFRIDARLSAQLADLARAAGATPYMLLLAAYQVLLSRHSGQSDFAVGSPVAGRDRPELERLVGVFVNMLTLRAQLADDPPFEELLTRTRDRVLGAFAHQELPFERLVSELDVPRDVRRSPLFQALFTMHNYEGSRSTADPGAPAELSVSWTALDLPATRFDIELHAVLEDGVLRGRFGYNTALLDRCTVEALAAQFQHLLGQIVAAPRTRVGALGLLDEQQRTLLTVTRNDTAVTGPDSTLTGLIEAQVTATPDAVAVTFEDRHLTFAELDARANQVAHRLRTLGVGPETLVAVCAERALELPVALLGVLKAGGAYVPLDPEHPAERLRFMLDDAQAPVLLTQQHLVDRLPAVDTRIVVLDDPARFADLPTNDPGPLAGADNAAYVIYTSGSTGRPKGVPNTHRGVVNRLDWMQRRYRLGHDDAVLQKTPTSFDVSVWELFWPLLTGARLVLARPGGQKDPTYLRELIGAQRITTAHFVPSMLSVFLTEDPGASGSTLRRIICSGEELPVSTAQQFLAQLPGCTLDNLYGPTEAAIDVSSWSCRPDTLADAATVPIGEPIQNVRLYVLDASGEPAAVGVPGELHIGGVAVARGYLRRPGLTAERFVPDPFGPPGSRLYRTGDLVRWNAAGVLEFRGRIDGDSQVKLRGLRIELGEIAAALRALDAVRDAVVVVREDVPGDQRLVAYLAAGPDEPDVGMVREEIRRTLPDYMIPSAFVVLDALPLSPNGKLDRSALPAPQRAASTGPPTRAPETPTERLVAQVWCDVLGTTGIGVDDDFFDLGGHSLLAMQVVARLRGRTGDRQIGVLDVFTHRTVRALAALAEDTGELPARPLLYELTGPVPERDRIRSYVCVPFGGGSAVVYQPLADALPAGHSLYAVAVPGQDVGVDDERVPFAELVRRCADEIEARVRGPLVLYGHCAMGGAMVTELARELEGRGRELDAVYAGGVFPMARPTGLLSRVFAVFDRFSSNNVVANWLTALGADIEQMDRDQVDRIIGNMRRDAEEAEERMTALFADPSPTRLRAPIISVVGERDPITDFHTERYREWHPLTGTVALIVVGEAGHYFNKYRADELAEIITRTDVVLAARPGTVPALPGPGPSSTWWLYDAQHRAPDPLSESTGNAGTSSGAPPPRRQPAAVRPSMRRFFAVAAGQLVSSTGTALTQWAVPVWIYLTTGSLVRFGLFAVVSVTPGLILAPVVGTLVDRVDRRRVLIWTGVAAGGMELAMAVLLWTGHLRPVHLYALVAGLSVALTFQRVAYTSAIPQLAPKRLLGHATGVAQVGTGLATLVVPVLAAGFLATIGLGGILAVDVASYLLAVGAVVAIRFPRTLGRRRRESFRTEVVGGFRYVWQHRGIRAMLVFSALINVFLAPVLLLLAPLVLSFGTLAQVAQVSFVDGLGGVLGGIVIGLWGGPKRFRMRGFLLFLLIEAVFLLVAGLRPSVPLVAVGSFAGAFAAVVSLALYTTIVQVKVSQRFHGRVFAINQMIAWSTLPLAYGVIAPLAASFAGPLLAPGGALADTALGSILGVGEGRGIGLVYVVFSIVMIVLVLVALRTRRLARFDIEVPDAVPDDVVGARAIEQRRADPLSDSGSAASADQSVPHRADRDVTANVNT